MRSKQNITAYVDMMAKLVQSVATPKAFKKNQAMHPFTDWVTVSDEAFLILLCLGNYERIWHAQKLRLNNGPPPLSGHEVGELIPEPRYTGKRNGTKQSWSKNGMKIFNVCMVRVHLDRAKNR
jgi:hypothetical protein